MKNKFTYNNWDAFCKKLAENDVISVPVCEMKHRTRIVLKHDVESSPKKAMKIAAIEAKYGHRGTYYFQHNLLKHTGILRQIMEMGHEVSYHYDTLDNNKGNLELARIEFEDKLNQFRSLGFECFTVCQHGNPLIERNGYYSNRDLFRNTNISDELNVKDIMVGFEDAMGFKIEYFSDAGFSLNRIINHEMSDISYLKEAANMNDFYEKYNNVIISIHTHRYMKSSVLFQLRKILFSIMKRSVRILVRVPILRKILTRFNFMSKRI